MCFSDDHVNIFFSISLKIQKNARKYNVGLETKHWCCRSLRWGQWIGIAVTQAALVLRWLWAWHLASGFGLVYIHDFLKAGLPGRLLPFVPWKCLWGGKGLLFSQFSLFWADNSALFCGSVRVLVGAESPKCCKVKFLSLEEFCSRLWEGTFASLPVTCLVFWLLLPGASPTSPPQCVRWAPSEKCVCDIRSWCSIMAAQALPHRKQKNSLQGVV